MGNMSMEINGSNNFSEPVRFYNKNTENIIKQEFEKESASSAANLFQYANMKKENSKTISHPIKRKRNGKRLNVIDSEYFPERTEEAGIKETDNIFSSTVPQKKENIISKSVKFVFTKVPLLNCFFLKKKSENIKETVKKLNDITSDVDMMLETQIPYGEDTTYYESLAKNLSNAAEIIGKSETHE